MAAASFDPREAEPRVWVAQGELYTTFARRKLKLSGWPELRASTNLAHRSRELGDPWWQVYPEMDLRRSILLPVRCSVPEQIERWCRWAEGPESARGLPNPWRSRRETERTVVREYFANLPAEVREAVEPFKLRQWGLLLLARRCPGGTKLITQHPALAFALVGRPEWMREDWKTAQGLRALVRGPAVELAKALRLREPDTIVALLDRLPAGECSLAALLGLKAAVRDGSYRRFADLPRLSGALLRLPKAVLENSAPEFLAELATGAGTGKECGAAWQCLWQTLRTEGEHAAYRLGFQSIAHLRHAHSELAGRSPERPLRCL
jgi:hypothetical protein